MSKFPKSIKYWKLREANEPQNTNTLKKKTKTKQPRSICAPEVQAQALEAFLVGIKGLRIMA